MLSGGCQCGAVRYEVDGEVAHHALCHCADCRASSGAPATAWMAYKAENFRVTEGEAVAYNSSGDSWRHFCGVCGTGLYFINETTLPGIVDIQSATLDDASEHAPVRRSRRPSGCPTWIISARCPSSSAIPECSLRQATSGQMPRVS